MAQNKITIRFQAVGDKALRDAIEQLRLSQIKLEKGSRAYQRALKKLNLEQGKQSKNSLLGVKNNRLLSNSFATLRSKMLLASFAATIVAATIGKVFKAASEQQQAEIKLSSALGRTSKALLDHASAMQQVTSFGDEVTISAMSNIAAFIKDEDSIKSLTTATMDLASAKGMDLASAADLVAKSVGSSTNALARYGIAANGAAKSTERAESVARNISVLYGGQAKAQAESYAGTMDGMKNAVGDAAEAIGELLAPVVIAFAQALKTTANAIEIITDKLAGLSQATFNYFFGLSNLKGATKEYSEGLKDFQQKLDSLPFDELIVDLENLEPMVKKVEDTTKETGAAFNDLAEETKRIQDVTEETGSVFDNTSVVFKKYEDDLRGLIPTFGTAIESTDQLNNSGDELKKITTGIANAAEFATDAQNRYNLALQERGRREAFAQELYAKTSESQAEATAKLIEWVEENKGAFETIEQADAALEMLNEKLKKQEGVEKFTKSWARLNQALSSGISAIEANWSAFDDKNKKKELAQANNIKNEKIRKKQLNDINDKYEAQSEARAKRLKEWKLASTLSNTALAIMQVWADPTIPKWAAIGFSTMVAATGLAQWKTIKGEEFAQGGLVGGRRHSQGGTMIEAEQGEFVLSRNAVDAIGIENMNRINQGTSAGGVNITFTGNVLTDDFIDIAIPKIKEAVRRGADIGVS